MLVNKHACVIIIHITSPYTLFQYSCPVFGYEMTCLLDQIESDISRSRSRHVRMILEKLELGVLLKSTRVILEASHDSKLINFMSLSFNKKNISLIIYAFQNI